MVRPHDVFINHRGPDVKRTLASLISHYLTTHGLRVFLDEQELVAEDSLPPEIKSAICSASVQIAIFSKTYAASAWCLNELLWILDSDSSCSKIIPIFYDIQPYDLRYVDKGEYATAFQDHKKKGRFSAERVESWGRALEKVSAIHGVVFRTEKDDHGERLEEIVEVVLKKVGASELHVSDYPVGLREAAEHFEKKVVGLSELEDTQVVGIVGLGGSGKSTLATYLYNSMCSRFRRCCFLSDVSKTDLLTLQEALLRDLVCDQNLFIENTRRGRTLLQDRLLGLTSVFIVLDDIDNEEQIDNLLFVKDVLGSGSLILVTSRDKSLLVSSKIGIYDLKLLDSKDAQELFCWYAFGVAKPLDDLQDTVEELFKMCGGFPLALKVLAGQLRNERDPNKWKRRLETLRKQLPDEILRQIVMDSYESLDVREKEAFLDVAHFLVGEDTDLVERVLDGWNDKGFECLQTLRYKCLVDFESADIFRRRALPDESQKWSIRVWRRAKGSFKIRMHDLVKELARQIGRQELSLRLCCCSNDKMISSRSLLKTQPIVAQIHRLWNLHSPFSHHISWIGRWDGSLQYMSHFFRKFGISRYIIVRGIRTDEDHQLPGFLQNQDICGLNLLAVHSSSILHQFKSVSGALTWLRLRRPKDISIPSPLLQKSLSNLIPSTLSLRRLRVLEIHGVDPQDFCNLFDDREPPCQLRALEVTCTKDFSGSSTAVSTKHGWASQASASLQPSVKLGHWLKKLNLKNLCKIVLQNIPGLETLPLKFEELRNLRHVDLSGCCDLQILPDSFVEELSQLQYLALRDCRKLVLPDLKKISTLEYLDCEGCSMLCEMPKGTEAQKSLKHLNLLHTELRTLPQSLKELKCLQLLHLGSPELTKMPSSLFSLSRLTDLTLLGCTKLLSIDNSIEKLVHLESFRMYKCGVRALPEGIAWSMNMKTLDVQWCPLDLDQLMGVFSRNMLLDSSQAQGSVDQVAFRNLSSGLTNLVIRGSCILEIHIPPLAKSLFPILEIVDLSDNRRLKEIGSLPGSLVSLNLMNCSTLRTLTCLWNLTSLKTLEISGCQELESINVDGLRSIQVIKGNGCWKLQTIRGLTQLQNLSYFQVSVNSLSRSRCRDIVSDTRQFSAGLHCRRIMEEYLDEMYTVVDVKGLEELEGCMEASVEIMKCNFSDEKVKGAILLFLITDPNCKIEVTFLDRAYTTESSSFDNSVHVLMWTKDSVVFNDFKFFKDGPIRLNIKLLGSTLNPLLKKGRLQQGWIVEAKNVVQMSSFVSQVFDVIPAKPSPSPDIT